MKLAQIKKINKENKQIKKQQRNKQNLPLQVKGKEPKKKQR